MTGEEIRALREALKMDPMRFAQLLGVHPSCIYRWEAAGPNAVRVVPLQLQFLTALQQQVAARREVQAQAELGRTILGGLLVGGTLLGLFKALESVFDNKDRQTGGAVDRRQKTRPLRSPTRRVRRSR